MMGLQRRFGRVALSLFLAGAVIPAVTRAEPASFKVIDQIKGPDGPWDYAFVDADLRRLFVARGDGVMTVNLDSGAVTPTFVKGGRVHGVITLPGGRAISTNGDTSTATLFQVADGKVLGEFPTGAKPDAVTRDSKTGLVVVMNGKDGTATLIDTDKMAVAGAITIGGVLEFAAADGQGHVFVNVEDKNELVFLDIPNRKVMAHYPMPDCDGPSGLALDNSTHVLLAVCGNGKAVAMSALDGHKIATLPIGARPDAAMIDEAGRRFLVPCGGDGTLSIISEAADGSLQTSGSVPTAKGARTGAFDAKTGLVYLPTAEFQPAKPGERPAAIPGSFHLVVLGPA
jgi:DNA-binding beta-propeller fold protein YncE